MQTWNMEGGRIETPNFEKTETSLTAQKHSKNL